MAIDVKEFVMSAIREGISEAPNVYLQELEKKLKVDVKIQESGDAAQYLQQMINEAEEVVES